MVETEKEVTEEVVEETEPTANENVPESSTKIFSDTKFYKPTQIASILCISPMTVVRTLDRNKTPVLYDPTQKKKIRLYRGQDLNNVFVFSSEV